MGFDNALHNPHCPVGKNTIAECPQNLSCAASITDWQQKTPHTPCAHMIAKLANDPNVNSKETAKATHHKNENSQNAHIHSTDTGATNKFSGLKNLLSGVALRAW